MRRVLVLSNYPAKVPYHGGQQRLSNMIKAYQRAGFEVTPVSVYEQEEYSTRELSDSDIPFPSDNKYRLYNNKQLFYLTDILAGEYLANDQYAWGKLSSIMHHRKIDLIHFEQPWLYPVVKKIVSTFGRSNVSIIYGSQNIESEAKVKVVESYADKKTAIDIKKLVYRIENESANISDLTIAVSARDAAWIKENSNQENVLIVPNGITPFKKQCSDLLKWKQLIDAEKWVAFVGSAHPPNIFGFREMIGESLGFLPPDTKLILMGSVSSHIESYLISNKFAALNLSRLGNFGKVNSTVLTEVINSSQALILPITQGGGTNLKTAEALYSGKYVIGTSLSFRGYEEYSKSSGVFVEDDPKNFRSRIVETLNFEPLIRTDAENSNIDKLTWEQIFKEFERYLQENFYD